MTQNTLINLSTEQIADLINLEDFLAEELEDENSVVRQYVTLAIIRIVLEHATTDERQIFNQLAENSEKEASEWIIKRAYPLKDRIIGELQSFLNKAKMESL